MKRGALSKLTVVIAPGERRRGTLTAGAIAVPVALGRAGAGLKRREGDGVTPIGRFALRRLHYRADRIARPATGLPIRRIADGDWWCDIPGDRAYNRLVTRRAPPDGSEERLKRADRLYDVVVEIGYNDRPVVRGRGSGIFLHVARDGLAPTAGCVAGRLRDVLRVLARVGPTTRIEIGVSPRRVRP